LDSLLDIVVYQVCLVNKDSQWRRAQVSDLDSCALPHTTLGYRYCILSPASSHSFRVVSSHYKTFVESSVSPHTGFKSHLMYTV